MGTGWDGTGWGGVGQMSHTPDAEDVEGSVSSSFAIRCCEEWGHSSFFPLLPWLDGAVSHRKEG